MAGTGPSDIGAMMFSRLGRFADPFEAATRMTRMPMVMTDPRQDDNPIVFANEAFYKLTGYSAGEVVGRNCRFLQGPETDPTTVARLREAIAACRPIELEVRNHRKNGEAFWNRLVVAPVRDEAGDVAYFFASQVDATLERETIPGLRTSNTELLAENTDSAHALAQSEARLQLAVDAGGLGVFERDLVTDELTTSAKSREHLGGPPEPPFSMEQLHAAAHVEDLPLLQDAFARTLATGAEFDLEYRMVRDDAPPAWVHIRAKLVRDPDGTPRRIVGTTADVSERRRQLDRSRAGEERLRLALEAGELGTWELDLDGDTATRSARHDAIFGYSEPPARWGVAAMHGHVVPDDLPIVKQAFARTVECGEPLTFRCRIRRADTGATRWIDVRGTALAGAEAHPRRLTGVIADVTEAVAAEAALKELNESLEARVAAKTRERDQLWQSTQDLLVVVGKDGVISIVNPAWERLLGWREDELVGHRFEEFVWEDDVAGRDDALALAAARELANLENRLRHRDGTPRWFSWTAAPVDGHVSAVGRHITAEKQASVLLRQAEETLRQAQKMEAVGQLTGGIAHDFNNLLTGTMGALELIGNRIAQGRLGELNRYLEAARTGMERAAALTHRLLAFSRRQTLDPKPVQANRLVADMEELIRRTTGPSIRLTVALAGQPWTTLCDPNQLENALLNLCINARDAMPDGGHLTIETANVTMEPGHAFGRELEPGDYVGVTVSDTGVGMPPEVVGRAFDPFFTTKPIGQGTGLGLSMAYGFARQSGGQIRIHSAVGLGTSVRVLLPRHDEPEIAAAARGTPDMRAMPDAARNTVLVVDDEAMIREMIVEVLEERGHATLQAEDGTAALRLLQSPTPIALLLTDVGLPASLNGRQLADAARVGRPDLRVLFITGYADTVAFGPGRLDPGMEVLTKPFAMRTLAERVAALLDRGA